MTQGAPFPGALPNDSEDVAWALSTAQAMWTRGDQAEAVKWVKRASDSAADAGDDDRAFALARAAAELRSAAPPSETPAAAPSKTPSATPAPMVVPMPPADPPRAAPTPLPRPVKPASVAPPARNPGSVAPPPKRVPSPPAARATPATKVPMPPAKADPEPEKPSEAPAAPTASKFGFPFPSPTKATGVAGRPVGNLRPPSKEKSDVPPAPEPPLGLIDDDARTNASFPMFAVAVPKEEDDKTEQHGSPDDWDTVTREKTQSVPPPAPSAATPAPPATRSAATPMPAPSGEVSSPVIGALRVWVVPAGNGQHKMIAARGARPSGAVEGLFIPTDDFEVRLLGGS